MPFLGATASLIAHVERRPAISGNVTATAAVNEDQTNAESIGLIYLHRSPYGLVMAKYSLLIASRSPRSEVGVGVVARGGLDAVPAVSLGWY